MRVTWALHGIASFRLSTAAPLQQINQKVNLSESKRFCGVYHFSSHCLFDDKFITASFLVAFQSPYMQTVSGFKHLERWSSSPLLSQQLPQSKTVLRSVLVADFMLVSAGLRLPYTMISLPAHCFVLGTCYLKCLSTFVLCGL